MSAMIQEWSSLPRYSASLPSEKSSSSLQRTASNRQGVVVRVDEHETGHAHRRIAEALHRATLARLAVEPLLDEAWIELHDLLDRHRDFVGSQLPPQRRSVYHCPLEQAGAESDALAHDDDVGVDVVAASSANADHATVFDDQTVDHRLRHHQRARLLGLLGKPCVETRAQHGVGVRMGAVADVLVVEADGGIRRHQPPSLLDDWPLQRSLLPVVAYDLFEVVVVQDAAHHVFRPGLRAALEERHL